MKKTELGPTLPAAPVSEGAGGGVGAWSDGASDVLSALVDVEDVDAKDVASSLADLEAVLVPSEEADSVASALIPLQM